MNDRGRRALMLAPLLLLLCAAQAPQSSPPPASPADPDESAVVQELLVVGHYPGPPLWTVKRGQGEVVVMGGLSPLPHMLQWNSHRLERLMDGSREVLLPPTGRLGALDLVYILFHTGDLQLSGGRKLWDVLTPEEKARFENFRVQAKTDPKRYERLKPSIAALILASDYEKQAGLSSAKPGTTVKTLAEQHHIPTRAEGGLPVGDVFKAVTRMDEQADRACFDAVMEETEFIARSGHSLTDAWANGDLGKVKAGGYLASGGERCVAGSNLQGLMDKVTRDATGSIDKALAKGGRTIAVVDIRLLLRANGVLDRLKAEGAEIALPRD